MILQVENYCVFTLSADERKWFGLIMHQLAGNKFVTPSTAGTVEAASLGILVSLLFFGGPR
jgi:iron complex transport system permease protein